MADGQAVQTIMLRVEGMGCDGCVRSVRDALVASVACTLPPVRRQIRKQSIVPAASSPRKMPWG
mgnify:CR=1 FL=1